MKKISFLLVTVLLLATFGKINYVKASGDYYVYTEVSEEDGTTRKAWFKNGEELPGNPTVIEEQSQITINATPDESCALYLETFYEPTSRVDVNPGVTVVFGSEETRTSIQGITCYDANVTIYAEEGEFQEDGSLPGSVYGVTCLNSTVNIYGNVQYLCLGDEFKYDSEKENKGSVVVNGLVYDIQLHTTSNYTYGENATEYYRGFKGNAVVTGKVGSIYVHGIRHSNVLGKDIKATIGEGYNLPNFSMTDGVIAAEINEYITVIEPDMESFYYEYTPLSDGTWLAVARYMSGMETGYNECVTTEEVMAGLASGTCRVVLDRDENVKADLSEYDVSELKVYRGEVSINNVEADGKGLLMVHSYGRENIDVDVKGDVDYLTISFTRFNENMNVNVDGTVKLGEVYKASLQSDTSVYLGSFTGKDMPIFINGAWNPDLFLSLGTTEYHPVDETVLDEALDLEKNVQNGDETVSEMADMHIKEMESDSLGNLGNDNDFNACVDEFGNVDVITGVEIQLEKFDYNETTGEVSNQEVVTELGDKDLSITIKVPEHKYEKGKKYVVVREHDNHGRKEMDVLEPRQDGDKLTFKTNKFSNFIIVEVSEDEEFTGMKKVNGEWCYLVDGVIATDYIGLAKNEYGWWYIKNGKIDRTYTGLAKNENGWWYVKNGQLNRTYTGMAKNEYGWWYVKNGQLNRTYTGMATNEYGTWYMVNGQINRNVSGFVKTNIGWVYLKAGQLDTSYTGLAKNDNGWWYVKNGRLDRTYTGMAKNEYGWWYVKNGQLDRTYTGLATNEYGTWYMKNGQLNRTFSGTITYNGVTYTVKNVKVN